MLPYLCWLWVEDAWEGVAEKQAAQGQVGAPVCGGGGAQWRANQLWRSEGMMAMMVEYDMGRDMCLSVFSRVTD